MLPAPQGAEALAIGSCARVLHLYSPAARGLISSFTHVTQIANQASIRQTLGSVPVSPPGQCLATSPSRQKHSEEMGGTGTR